MSAINTLNFAVQYTLYSGWIIFTLGVISNIINLLVFTQRKLFRDNPAVLYLTVETISNLFFQLTYLDAIILTTIYGDDASGRSIVWCKFKYILGQTIVLTEYYMVCCAAIDQFFATNHRPHLRQRCTLKQARYITFTLICLSIAHSILFGMFFDIQPSIGCMIPNLIFRQYVTFFVYPFLSGLLPIIVSAIFSLLAFRNVRRIVRRQISVVRRRLDRQITAMVLIRAVFFVCLASPYSFYRIYTFTVPVSKTEPTTFAIRQLIQAVFFSFFSLNFTVNFYIFIISSVRFRRQVKCVLLKKYWKQCYCYRNTQVAPVNGEQLDSNIELQ